MTRQDIARRLQDLSAAFAMAACGGAGSGRTTPCA